MIYKLVEAKNGKKMYYGDRKLIKPDSIPADILKALEPGLEINSDVQAVFEQAEAEKKKPKVCLFCGQPPEHERYFNLQRVDLCSEHYQSMNVGKIAQRLRESSSAIQEQQAEEIPLRQQAESS